MQIFQSIFLFVAAGLAEIAGGYMVWMWLRKNEPILWGIIGGAVLVLYGIIPTFQSSHFGRVYAAYGGIFAVMSLLWGWWVDKRRPDSYDWVGALVVILGVAIIMYWPRGAAAE